MASSRSRYRRVRTLAAAIALIVAGGTAIWAWQQGFLGTVFVALSVATWLTLRLALAADRPRSGAATASTGEGAGDQRILLQVLLDQAPTALLVVEGGAQVRAVNRAARDLFATDDRVLPPPSALLSHDVARFHHGGRRWRIDRAAVQGAGAPATLLALVDVEPEEHAAEARATRELLRVLGHEVMNAMAPIASLAESALGIVDAGERRAQLLPEILGTLARRADGLRRFTEAYRQVARLPEPALARVRIADLFADIALLFANEWQARAMLRIDDPGEAAGTLDRDQIVQALLALLRNGAEAAVGAGVQPVVRLSAFVGDKRLRFDVIDNGPGVDPGSRDSIFLPFFTTKVEGNGIGLAAARQIVQAHGGDASLRQSDPTMFSLSLPQ